MINNPLSVIVGQLYFLGRDPLIPAARLEKMQEAAERIGDIVRRMSQLTRLELRRQAPGLPEMFELDPPPPSGPERRGP